MATYEGKLTTFFIYHLPVSKPTATADTGDGGEEVADFFTLEDLVADSCGICTCTTSQLRNAPQLNKDGTCARCGGR